MEAYLEAGKIVNTHGVSGDVKIETWCDSAEAFCRLKTLFFESGDHYSPVTVTKSVPFKGMALVHIKGCEDMDSANRLRGRVVFASRDDLALPEGSYFIADLVGLKVYNAESGKVYGVVSDVIKLASGSIYEIDTPDGKAYLPAVKEFVCGVDLSEGIAVTPIEGIFNEI